MTYNQALMVVRNIESGYAPEHILKAAVTILGKLHVNEGDMNDATDALYYARAAIAAQGGAK